MIGGNIAQVVENCDYPYTIHPSTANRNCVSKIQNDLSLFRYGISHTHWKHKLRLFYPICIFLQEENGYAIWYLLIFVRYPWRYGGDAHLLVLASHISGILLHASRSSRSIWDVLKGESTKQATEFITQCKWVKIPSLSGLINLEPPMIKNPFQYYCNQK